MKILFLNYEYPPLGGGAANATECILRQFSAMDGLEVDLVTSSIDAQYHLEKIGENIRIHKLPIGKNAANLHFQSQKDLLLYTWRAWRFSSRLVRKAKKSGQPYDLSHSFFTVPCGFISLLLRWRYGLSYIVSLRGSDVPGYSDRFTWLYKLITPIITFIWRRSDQVIANSQGLKELALRSASRQTIGVIYNGIDTDQFRPADKPTGGRFVITPGASRITDRKGLNYLVAATLLLVGKYPQLLLKIMGDGNAREKLEQQVKNAKLEKHVRFVGRIPHEEVVPYYQEASVFVFPSLNEGMSNAMLEALSCGLPIISTNTGGASELVRDGENGFIINFKDAKDIADKIEQLIKDENLRKKMAQSSRELAEKMSWNNVAREYLAAYQKTGQKHG